MFRANVDVEENDVVYARSYLVDANGNTVYGEVKTVNIGSFTTSGFDSEIITCGSFDSTLAQADEIIVSAEDVPTQEETETAPTFMSILMNIINAVISLFQTIIALF